MKDSGWQLWHVYQSDEKFWYHRQSGRTAGYQTFAPLLIVYLPGSRGLSFKCSLHRCYGAATSKAPEVEAEAARLREARRAANLASDAAAKAASAGSRKRRAR